jgi:Putative inner membrane protein (DUF1819)
MSAEKLATRPKGGRRYRTMPASTTELEQRLRPSAPYSSKIIKAGALIGDTKTLLSHWDIDASVAENVSQMRRDNVFGKASRARVEAILAIFRIRYLNEQSVTKALVTLVRKKSRLPLWSGCCIFTPHAPTGCFAIPSLKFLFRCMPGVWWTSTSRVSNGLWQSG